MKLYKANIIFTREKDHFEILKHGYVGVDGALSTTAISTTTTTRCCTASSTSSTSVTIATSWSVSAVANKSLSLTSSTNFPRVYNP